MAAPSNNLPKNDHVNEFKPKQGPGLHLSHGIHDPTTPYKPSNPLAWGPKGEWGPKKTAEALSYEAQYNSTQSYYTQEGFVSDQYTWEARGKQEEATFRPNPRNIAPRPKAWSPAAPISH